MSYLRPYLDGKYLRKLVARCVLLLENYEVDFDTIAVRGQSGLLVGSPLAMEMSKDIIIVRKEEESAHSSDRVENWSKNQRILIVDDFIESGVTINKICEAINENCDSPEIVGILLYASLEEQEFCDYTDKYSNETFFTYNLYRFSPESKEGRGRGW